MILGPIANLLAASAIIFLRRRPFFASLVGSLIIGLIVGGYLWIFFPPPEIFAQNLQGWASMVISITLSSIIAILGLGYILFHILN